MVRNNKKTRTTKPENWAYRGRVKQRMKLKVDPETEGHCWGMWYRKIENYNDPKRILNSMFV